MDADSWSVRLSSASKCYQSALQSRSEVDVDDDIREEFPFCSENVDIVISMCKRKSLKRGSHSTLSLLRREMREGNLQSISGGSSSVVSSNNRKPDPSLSSFILSMDGDFGCIQSHSSTEKTSIKKSSNKNVSKRTVLQTPPLSSKDKEEKARKCEFVQGLLLSTILKDNS